MWFKAAVLAEKVPDISGAVEFPKLSWGLGTCCRGSYSSFYFERVPSLYIQCLDAVLFLLQQLVHAIKGPQKDRRWERPWSVKDKAYTWCPASRLGVCHILASVNLAILQSFSSFFFFFLSHWLLFTKSRSWHHKHTSGTKRFPLNLWLSLVFKAFRVAPFQNQVNICTLPEGRLWGEIQTAL